MKKRNKETVIQGNSLHNHDFIVSQKYLKSISKVSFIVSFTVSLTVPFLYFKH